MRSVASHAQQLDSAVHATIERAICKFSGSNVPCSPAAIACGFYALVLLHFARQGYGAAMLSEAELRSTRLSRRGCVNFNVAAGVAVHGAV